MTESEDKKRGVLTVEINYLELAQDIKCAIYFLNRLSSKLDRAAIDRKILDGERRKGDRRVE